MPVSGWINAEDASNLIGVELTDADLARAEIDIRELIRWEPVHGIDLASGSDRDRSQAAALGRAIAWQAAYRKETPPAGSLSSDGIASESIGSYSVTYDGSSGIGASATYHPRVRDILASAGLMRLTGNTGRSGGASNMIPIIE